MPRQWWPTNPIDIYSVTLSLYACAECMGSQVIWFGEFKQTHNASMFSSKYKTFALQVRIT